MSEEKKAVIKFATHLSLVALTVAILFSVNKFYQNRYDYELRRELIGTMKTEDKNDSSKTSECVVSPRGKKDKSKNRRGA